MTDEERIGEIFREYDLEKAWGEYSTSKRMGMIEGFRLVVRVTKVSLDSLVHETCQKIRARLDSADQN